MFEVWSDKVGMMSEGGLFSTYSICSSAAGILGTFTASPSFLGRGWVYLGVSSLLSSEVLLDNNDQHLGFLKFTAFFYSWFLLNGLIN